MIINDTFEVDGLKLAFVSGFYPIDGVFLMEEQDLSNYTDAKLGNIMKRAMREHHYWKSLVLIFETSGLGFSASLDEKITELLLTTRKALIFYRSGKRLSKFDAKKLLEEFEAELIAERDRRIRILELEKQAAGEDVEQLIPKTSGFIYIIKVSSPQRGYRIRDSKIPLYSVRHASWNLPSDVIPLYNVFVEDMYGTKKELYEKYSEKQQDDGLFLLNDFELVEVIEFLVKLQSNEAYGNSPIDE